MPQSIQLWHIYYVPHCRHTIPHPKGKLVVIVCEDGLRCMGFLINSRIVAKIQNDPDLLACQVDIPASDHTCLSHDSYVDCIDLYPFERFELNHPREPVTDIVKVDIFRAVLTAKTIAPRYKRLILGDETTDD